MGAGFTWPRPRSHLSPSVGSDGAGRSGTYVLIDMVLNKMAKGEVPSERAGCFVGAEAGRRCRGNLRVMLSAASEEISRSLSLPRIT